MLDVDKIKSKIPVPEEEIFPQERFILFEEVLRVSSWLEVSEKPLLEALSPSLGLNETKLVAKIYLSFQTGESNSQLPYHQRQRAHADTLKQQRHNAVLWLEKPWRASLKGYKLRDVEVVNFKADCYEGTNSSAYYHNTMRYPCYVDVLHRGLRFVLYCHFDVAEQLFDIRISPDLNFMIGDKRVLWASGEHLLKTARSNSRYHGSDYRTTYSPFNFTIEGLAAMMGQFPVRNQTSVDNLLLKAADLGMAPAMPPDLKKKGVTKVCEQIAPVVDFVRRKSPLAYLVLRSFVANCHRTIDKVKVSTVFNQEFKDAKTVDDVIRVLEPLLDPADEDDAHYGSRYGCNWFQNRLKNMPSYKGKRRAALKSNSTRAFNKLMQEYDFLSLDEKVYPRTSKAIKEGEVPIGAFFRKKEQYFLLNDNWALWEGMLKKHRDIVIEMAGQVAKRTTYEKDLMSYFYFILHALPAYLKKHTGKKWTCLPKLVNSSKELEPPKADGGVARERSALTPIVDNQKNTVTVPYASLAMGGSYGTTYCYSHTYNVIQRGLNFNGNVCMNDLEEKLNGRDDYGLMFYTLTGSQQGRGYPTFLIIFERLQAPLSGPRRNERSEIRVHFHRTHPSRSKDGDYNPIHNWTKVCYNWMVGNTPRSLIRYQQGDLVFVEDVKEREFRVEPVDAYDHHVFEIPVDFCPYTAKSKAENILGYIRVNEETVLNHTEHKSVTMAPGRYVIRGCRSWEANPSGVWSLRID